MTPSELATLRRALLARLAQIVRSAPNEESPGAHEHEVAANTGDASDDAILDQLEGIVGELNDRDAHLADSIVAAVDRMETGEYGLCIDCGLPIAFARLEAIPWAERCAEDQAAVDGSAPHATL